MGEYALGHLSRQLGVSLVMEIRPSVVKRYQADRLKEKLARRASRCSSCSGCPVSREVLEEAERLRTRQMRAALALDLNTGLRDKELRHSTKPVIPLNETAIAALASQAARCFNKNLVRV